MSPRRLSILCSSAYSLMRCFLNPAKHLQSSVWMSSVVPGLVEGRVCRRMVLRVVFFQSGWGFARSSQTLRAALHCLGSMLQQCEFFSNIILV